MRISRSSEVWYDLGVIIRGRVELLNRKHSNGDTSGEATEAEPHLLFHHFPYKLGEIRKI